MYNIYDLRVPMLKQKKYLRLLLSFAMVVSMLPFPQAANAQDLVATEDLAGGSSVFVFRESRKRPQSRAGGGTAILGGGGSVKSSGSGKSQTVRSNAQIAAAAQKRRAAAVAARKQAAKAAANRKVTMSNTLTAKAETFLDNNQTDAAIKNYRDALIQNPKNTRASDGLSNALTAKGIEVAGDANNTAATIYFDEAVKYDKQNDVAYAKLGSIYDANGQKDMAVVSYEKAVAINPDYSLLYAPLGLKYMDSGEIAKAETCLKKSDAAGVDNVDVRFLRGLVFFKQNKNEESLAAFNQALELEGRFAEAQYYRGQLLDRTGKTEEAIASYKTTLQIDPKFTPASFELGVAYYNAGDYNNAAAAYQEVIKNDPNNYQAHANLASVYRQLERFADANASYKLASAGVTTVDLFSEWGFCLGKTNEWDKAVARLLTAKEMSPVAIDNSNLGWAYYNLANSQIAAKDTEGAKVNFALAKTYLEVAVVQDPKLDAAYLNLGSTHNSLGDFQAAVNILTTVLSFRRDWLIATNQLGMGYRGLKDFKNAVATFKRVVDLDGNNISGLFNLGETYNASGNKKEAKKINDRLRRINPLAASRLDDVLSGKVVIDAARQTVEQTIPKAPSILKRPRFPL